MILGAITGLLGSIIPQALKFIQDRQDKKHELELMKLQVEQAEKLNQLQMQQAVTQAEIEATKNAYQYAVVERAETTGNKFMDVVNTLVYAIVGTTRPVLTYCFTIFYGLIKYAQYTIIVSSGSTSIEALAKLWTESDGEFVACIISFWFGGRLVNKIFK